MSPPYATPKDYVSGEDVTIAIGLSPTDALPRDI